MLLYTATSLLAILATTNALNPGCAPGGNFDLSKWQLQLPIGTKNNPDQIPANNLTGCDGYEDASHQYFFTESGDGAMVMKVPGDPGNSGCVTFKESSHCRTEFAEVSPSSWSTSASENRMKVDLIGISGSQICIGQAFQANSNLKPVAEIYYYSNGDLKVGVEKVPEGHSQQLYSVTNISHGTRFTYELRYESGKLGISVNGGNVQNLPLFFDTDRAFFKMGNYNQGSDKSDIHVFGLTTTHS